MRRDRKNKTILLSVLVALIFSMSIVFAAMSTTLKVKGSGLVSTSEWSIKFENLSPATLKGAAQETTAPTIKNDTEIGEYSVVLKRTGDEVVYNFDIHNYGKVNAKIEELNIPTPVCTGNATDEEQKIADAQIVSESIAYTLTYSDGTEVNVGDTLKADEVKSLVLKLAYTGENMPSESVQITGLAITMKHGQDMSSTGDNDDETLEDPTEETDPATIAGKRYANKTKIKMNDKIVTIPGGATVSGITGEYENVDEGIVTYVIPEGEEVTDWNADTNGNGIIDVQENYDQFVWIPVENAVLDLSNNAEALSSNANVRAAVNSEVNAGRYPMAIKKDENDYFGVMYSISDYDNEIYLSSWSPLDEEGARLFLREPAYLTDETNGDASPYNNVDMTEASLQEDFNNMVKRVENNKGFWVGRYETSNMYGGDNESDNSHDTTQRVSVIKGTINGVNGISTNQVNWYRMYAQQKNYSKLSQLSNTSNSYMMWECQKDQITFWMKDVKNKYKEDVYYIIDSVGMGNYGVDKDGNEKSSENQKLEPTGNSEDYRVKNIYDLAGNLDEYCMGAHIERQKRNLSGGSYIDTDEFSLKASSNNSSEFYSYESIQFYGSRMVLY